MNLCEKGHDVVCYTCNECPVCMFLDTIETLEEEIDNLTEELKDAKR